MRISGNKRFVLLVSLMILNICGAPTPAPVNTTNSSTLSPIFLDEDFDDHPYLVSLRYHLNEVLLPELCTAIALREVQCPIKECNISFIDIAEATHISKYTTDDIAEALGRLNISFTDIYKRFMLLDVSVANVEKFLRMHSINLSEVYKNFVDSLPNPVHSIPDILNVLNINMLDFINAQAYGNDTVKLQVLSTGSYSLGNIKKVLDIANKTAIDMIKLLPLNKIIGQLNVWDPTVVIKLIKNFGVTSKNANEFYQRLGITPITFLSYPPFIQMVTGLYELLNPEEILGTAVSSHTIVTNNKAVAISNYANSGNEIAVKYFIFHAELVENPLIQYNIKDVTWEAKEYESKNIALINIRERISEFVEHAKDYNETIGNCTYITKLPLGEEYSENVTNVRLINHTIIMTKNNATVFNLGSPLLCKNKLYGIANTENIQSIEFATFIKRNIIMPMTTVTTTSSTISQLSATVVQKPSIASIAKYTFNLIFPLIFVLCSL